MRKIERKSKKLHSKKLYLFGVFLGGGEGEEGVAFGFKSAYKYTEKLSFAIENMKTTIDKTIKNRTCSLLFSEQPGLWQEFFSHLYSWEMLLFTTGDFDWGKITLCSPALRRILSNQVIDLSKLTQRHSQQQHQVGIIHLGSSESLEIPSTQKLC